MPVTKAKQFKEGDRVKVMRQEGKNGPKEEVTGKIERFMSIVLVGGQRTALIEYDDGKPSYAHPISKLSHI